MTILFAILFTVGVFLIVTPIILVCLEVAIRGEKGILMMFIGFLLFVSGIIGIVSVG